MKCPIDGTELRMADRNGVEIDYCPQCRGVWLDRGELDKIIERTTQAEDRYAERRTSAAVRGVPYDNDDDDYYFDDYTGKRKRRYPDSDEYKKRRRRGFIEDLFDIFD